MTKHGDQLGRESSPIEKNSGAPMSSPLTHLGDLSVQDFLRDYWQKKPLLVRGAFADFVSPLDGDELAGLALEEEAESRLIFEHGENPWELWRGPFTEEQFAELPPSHWTLLVQAEIGRA